VVHLFLVTSEIYPHKKALELGDAVCLFPEGFSRFHPTIAPLKTGGEPFIVCFRELV
jgi:hypothetical protein